LSQLGLINPFKLPDQRNPVQQHTLVLDHPDEPLEPLYFNLLDELKAHDDWRTTILVDTGAATQRGRIQRGPDPSGHATATPGCGTDEPHAQSNPGIGATVADMA
jgi:hypothetical protein